jgi:hypothetical protein
MNVFDLREFIKIAKKCDSLIDAEIIYDGKPAWQYLHRSYSNKFGVQYAWDQIYDTMWYYSKNPNIGTLLKLFRGTADEFAEAYGMPYEMVHKWEIGEETPPEYLLDILFSEMLNNRYGNYYLHPEYFEDSVLYTILGADGEW